MSDTDDDIKVLEEKIKRLKENKRKEDEIKNKKQNSFEYNCKLCDESFDSFSRAMKASPDGGWRTGDGVLILTSNRMMDHLEPLINMVKILNNRLLQAEEKITDLVSANKILSDKLEVIKKINDYSGIDP